MKNWVKIVGIFGTVISYILLINIFASLISFSYTPYLSSEKIIGGSVVEISVGTSVGVSVTRVPHWYGRFYINNGNEILNLFYIFNIPWKIKSYNFIWFHLIFLTILILFTILIFTKRKVIKEENLENEKLGEDFNNLGHLLPSYDS